MMRPIKRLVAFAALLVVVTGCGVSPRPAAPDTARPSLLPPPGGSGEVPGAYNPAVTQATIRATICVPDTNGRGYINTVHGPSASYTDPIKLADMRKLGIPASEAGQWVLDHFIPIALGGAPQDPANLWVEPIGNAGGDAQVEAAAWQGVCDGAETLAQAQQNIIDWKRGRD